MPKRKAALKPEEDVRNDGFVSDDLETAPPAKRQRGRPKATATKAPAKAPAAKVSAPKVTKPKPVARKTRSTATVAPKQRGTRARPAQAISDSVETELSDASHDNDVTDEHELNGLSEDELDSPETAAVRPPPKRALKSQRTPAPQRGRKKAAEKQVVKDGEFEYTPTASREEKSVTQSRSRAQKVATPVEPTPSPEPEQQSDDGHEHEIEDEDEDYGVQDGPAEVEETVPSEHSDSDSPLLLSSPLKSLIHELTDKAHAKTPTQRRTTIGRPDNAGSAANEAALRRKLGETTKKLESMEAKYRNLREVGIVQASANVEKIRKECENLAAGTL